jgi:hypothetical protein
LATAVAISNAVRMVYILRLFVDTQLYAAAQSEIDLRLACGRFVRSTNNIRWMRRGQHDVLGAGPGHGDHPDHRPASRG